MISALDHNKEAERLNELESFSILDTLPEEDYDNLTAIASAICNTKISLVSLLDDKRQWFKSHHGLDATETPKDQAFCAHAILQEDIFIIEDSRTDERFHDNPLVVGAPTVIFYAGVPLVTDSGLPMGTLCVIDNEPKHLTEEQKSTLKILARQVVNIMLLRKKNLQLKDLQEELEENNSDLEQFAYHAAHDLKSPLNNIELIVDIVSRDKDSTISKESKDMLGMLNESTSKLKKLINNLLQHAKHSSSVNIQKKSVVQTNQIIPEISKLLLFPDSFSIKLNTTLTSINVNKNALEQITLNLFTNAIKYNDKESTEIELGISETEKLYTFYVSDNGPGISPKFHDGIFKMLKSFTKKDKYGNKGTGIGLATVRKIVRGLGGTISIESEVGQGAKFIFTIAK